jgi:hypothetical protein
VELGEPGGWSRTMDDKSEEEVGGGRSPQNRLTGRLPLVLALAGIVAFVACKKDPEPEPEPAQVAAAQAAPLGAPATTVAAGASSKHEGDGFSLAIKPVGSYEAGKAGSVEVVLDAKSPYKCNDKYPYKFKASESAGIKYSAPVVKQDAVKLDKQRAVMTVGFTPATAGQKTVAGQFSFSVCTDERCLVEKRDLALNIDVK